jgi:hypothetical protein
MKEKAEQERQQIESIVSDELANLRQNLNSATQNALDTIKSDMEAAIMNSRETLKDQTATLNLAFGKRWLMVSLIALAATIGVTLGSWSLVKLMEWKITTLYQEISQLQEQQSRQQTAAKQLEAKTWGLELLDSPEGRFIILQPKTQARTGWTQGNRQAIKVE